MDAQMQMILSAIGSMPKTGPTLLVGEFTANGQQGWAYNTWNRFDVPNPEPDEDGSQWICEFVSWLQDPSATSVVHPKYRWDNWDVHDMEREEELVRVHGATLENLMWRRIILKNNLNMNADYFDQEHPATAAAAWRSSGSPGIPRNLLERQTENIRDPMNQYIASFEERGPAQPSMTYSVEEEDGSETSQSVGE